MVHYATHKTGSVGSLSSTTLPVNRPRKHWARKAQISRKQAETMREELVRPLNLSPFRSLKSETFENFVEDVFIPMKLESGDWRENTGKESTREIRKHLLADLGDVSFEELSPALVRALLKKKAEQGSGKQVLKHLRSYLTDICKTAVAEGYLQTNISEDLKAPVKLAAPSAPKLTATLEDYGRAWTLLEERERLCFDLVMFAGMRESEAFALWCEDIADDGIHIERSWYKGRYEPPKTPKSDRSVGAPDEIMNRVKSWTLQIVRPRCERLRISFHIPGDTDLAGERSKEVCSATITSRWAGMDKLRRAPAFTLHLAQETEIGQQDYRRPAGPWDAYSPGRLRSERGGSRRRPSCTPIS